PPSGMVLSPPMLTVQFPLRREGAIARRGFPFSLGKGVWTRVSPMLMVLLAGMGLGWETRARAMAPAVVPPAAQSLAQPVAQLSGAEQTNIRVYQRASPAVVSIEAGRSTGSGGIVDSAGLILTNAHVVRRSRRSPVVVVFPDGRRLNGRNLGVGIDGLDLALLKVDANNLPTVQLAPPNAVQVGQRAFAIGNPFGRFQGTFTAGVVSRLDRQRGLIQTDAAINPGNSGGPLLDSQGRLIGINTAIFTGRSDGNIGIGFAIATERVIPFLADARAGQLPTTAQTPSQSRPLPLDGSPVQGALQRGDRQLAFDDSYYDIYTFNGRAGQQISAELTSREFGPYLILLDSNGRDLVQSGADEGSTTSRFVETLPSSGPYQIYVNSRFPGQTGAYSLRARLGGALSRRSPQPPSPEEEDPSVLFRHAGQLDRNSRTLDRDGSAFDDYYFRGEAGQRVVINLDSPDFDSYLVLVDPEGNVLDSNDDRTEGNTNSTVRATLPRDGAYRVIINAYRAGQLGRYQVVGRQP
ncbi:MAG: trypsin-like peptidase domain-containing protein, partial [Cyanobacteria bacterium P01_H01_bin.130]